MSYNARDIRSKLEITHQKLATLQDTQTKGGVNAVADSVISPLESAVNQDLEVGAIKKARRDLDKLAAQVPVWQQQVADAIQARQKQQAVAQLTAQNAPKPPLLPTEPFWQVPILLYHDTPADFENELQTIVARGYHGINLAQLRAAILSGGALPSKPVIITFDDGYANQMTAFNLLEKYSLKATFYIIDGGEASNWCIGAGRQYNLPSQPASGCGDAYLTWDQVKQLDQSGLITVGSHTIDHLDLPSVSADTQRYEIVQGKVQLEAQLGHSVQDFAYPDGAFNSTTVSIVQSAGFLTAVSTIPGTTQTRSTLYSLRRIRSAYDLP